MPISPETIEDLARSGLTPDDIDVREASNLEFSAIGLSSSHNGYMLPYRDITGKLRPFYRIKLFDHTVKYKQPKNTSNHLYFPKQFFALTQAEIQKRRADSNYRPRLLIVEGEKKAARVCKAGIPAVGLGGVDSWKNRNLAIPEGSDLGKSYDGKSITVKLPQGASDMTESGSTILAKGLMDLIDFVVSNAFDVILCYDSDTTQGTKFEVQRAAASLAFEIRYRGIPFKRIHQTILPVKHGNDKVGVDDFLEIDGDKAFHELLEETLKSRNSFPKHPNVRELVTRKLQSAKMSRKECQAVAMAVLSDLDSTGHRLRSESENQAYYFDQLTGKLIKANMNMHNRGQIHESSFGQLLYKRYGLSAADQRLMTWLDAQFHGEDPIDEVTPHRVIARPNGNEDVIRYQISDGQYVKVTGDAENPYQVLRNGADGYLFEAGQVEAINEPEFREALESVDPGDEAPMPCWWDEVLSTVRLKDAGRSKTIAAMLFYLSPWFYKWRGSQLPVELILGESGSGKSSLYEHRLNVLTGTPELRNAPTDLKDWHASISNTGGLHVTDNVQLMDKGLRQRLSDEICRLVTEPNPHVEMRKLYSNNELIRIPVSCCFSITAIQQPFQQADLLARSIVLNLDKSSSVIDGADITYEANWVPYQMQRFGGRANWIAHHLMVIHRFLRLVEQKWDPRYVAKHRLINFEQALILMGEVFGLDLSWVPDYLNLEETKQVSQSDWALEGLTFFARTVLAHNEDSKRWSAAEIANWAMSQDDYMECVQITNSRRLGRYLQTHRSLIARTAGIVESGKANNKIVYSVQSTVANQD